eukprot:scaffold9278_cov117-Isochrysis_galbana.AAC.12
MRHVAVAVSRSGAESGMNGAHDTLQQHRVHLDTEQDGQRVEVEHSQVFELVDVRLAPAPPRAREVVQVGRFLKGYRGSRNGHRRSPSVRLILGKHKLVKRLGDVARIGRARLDGLQVCTSDHLAKIVVANAL